MGKHASRFYMKHLGATMRGRLDTRLGVKAIADGGAQIRYLESLKFIGETKAEELSRYVSGFAERYGKDAATAMASYFNPKGAPISDLPCEIRDMWAATIRGEILQRPVRGR